MQRLRQDQHVTAGRGNALQGSSNKMPFRENSRANKCSEVSIRNYRVDLNRPFPGHMGPLQRLNASTTRENTWLIASAQIMQEALFKTVFPAPLTPIT